MRFGKRSGAQATQYLCKNENCVIDEYSSEK